MDNKGKNGQVNLLFRVIFKCRRSYFGKSYTRRLKAWITFTSRISFMEISVVYVLLFFHRQLPMLTSLTFTFARTTSCSVPMEKPKLQILAYISCPNFSLVTLLDTVCGHLKDRLRTMRSWRRKWMCIHLVWPVTRCACLDRNILHHRLKLQQIYAEKQPLAEVQHDSVACNRMHLGGKRPGRPLIPNDPTTMDVELFSLVEKCWATEPEDRPDMSYVLGHEAWKEV